MVFAGHLAGVTAFGQQSDDTQPQAAVPCRQYRLWRDGRLCGWGDGRRRRVLSCRWPTTQHEQCLRWHRTVLQKAACARWHQTVKQVYEGLWTLNVVCVHHPFLGVEQH